VNDSKTCDSIDTLTQRNVEAIGQLEEAANQARNKTDVLADVISGFVGSMPFVYIHLIWFGSWILCNTIAPRSWHFDSFPFTFLTFIVSLEAIFLSTFILISQNHEELLARRRNHLDLQINLLSEQENSQILKMLTAIESRLHVPEERENEGLKAAVQPEQLASQIETVIESSKT
jgi:uncharacterized membrane protein